MKRLMTQLLNLPGVIVENSLETESTIILSVRVTKKTAVCPRCGQKSHRLHQNKRHLVKDLPISNREVIVSVNRRQFKWEFCQKPFSEILYFVGHKKSFTQRFAQDIRQEVIHSDINNVATNNRLTAEKFESMVTVVAESVINVDVRELRRLGIDEISVTAHRNCVAVSPMISAIATHSSCRWYSKKTCHKQEGSLWNTG